MNIERKIKRWHCYRTTPSMTPIGPTELEKAGRQTGLLIIICSHSLRTVNHFVFAALGQDEAVPLISLDKLVLLKVSVLFAARI